MLVSVSLWSITHSYMLMNVMMSVVTNGFRLLTEYHSFLSGLAGTFNVIGEFPSPYGVSFILILKHIKFDNDNKIAEFPSPYGVSFILIYPIVLL